MEDEIIIGEIGSAQDHLHNIIMAVAKAEEKQPTKLTPPLENVINTDALELLLESGSPATEVRFHYCDWEVVVYGDGAVTVQRADG